MTSFEIYYLNIQLDLIERQKVSMQRKMRNNSESELNNIAYRLLLEKEKTLEEKLEKYLSI